MTGHSHRICHKLRGLLLVVLVAFVGFSGRAAETGFKKLIEFGWDEPDTEFLRQHIAEMEAAPFDGCVFHINYRKPGGKSGNFTWEAWGTNVFAETDLKSSLDDLKATGFRRFTHNFLRFNTTPARLDWFDDYSVVLDNARLAGRIARVGGCKGLLFDIEQYDGQLFDFRKQRAGAKSWDDYSTQVRRRGREVMDAFQTGFPDLTVFLTFGYSLPWQESGGNKDALTNAHYGLLAPFLDGLLEAARGRAVIVDGNESAYGFKDTNRFAVSYLAMKEKLLPVVHDAAAYHRFFSLGFGVWMDYDWRKKGWEEMDVAKNFYPPEAFEASVRTALATADEYVWVYTETPRWWSAGGSPVKLPASYAEALRRARKGLARE